MPTPIAEQSIVDRLREIRIAEGREQPPCANSRPEHSFNEQGACIICGWRHGGEGSPIAGLQMPYKDVSPEFVDLAEKIKAANRRLIAQDQSRMRFRGLTPWPKLESW